MVLVTANKHQRLLCINYVQSVTPEELDAMSAEFKAMLAEMPPDFRLLADFSQLEHMDPNCSVPIGRTMELIHDHGVGLIVRVFPDPTKDIGIGILTIFHYSRQPRVISCQNLAEALQKLAQWA